MKLNRKAVFLWITSIMALCVIAFGIFYYRYIYLVDKYSATLTRTYPHLDRLNLRVFVDTPPPGDATLTDLAVDIFLLEAPHLYGRAVEAKFQTNLPSDALIAYYEKLLQPTGWEKMDDNDSYGGRQKQAYVKGTACIEIVTSSSSQEFSIKIWHDFWKQDFSPLQDLWAMKEIGARGGGFVTCDP